MACAPIHTGAQFLSATLDHIDCQARALGAYGYGALADPGSPTSIALTGLLTIFIALFGVRLLIGHAVRGKDLVGEILRVGIVLTIATSWPAWRTVAYDLVLNGPADIASSAGVASGLPGSRRDMAGRLQNADEGIVAMTAFGSGRLTGDVVGGTDAGDAARGIALGDQFAFGIGRTLFLGSVIGSTAIVRLGAGVLLAIAPLMAGLLLFSGTSSIFTGWLRGLAFCAIGNIALLLTQGIQLALLYPWIGDVLQQRASHIFTPSAPTELLVLMLGFAIATAGLLALAAKLVFFGPGVRLSAMIGGPLMPQAETPRSLMRSAGAIENTFERGSSRALIISEAVSQRMIREDSKDARRTPSLLAPSAAPAPAAVRYEAQMEPGASLGSSFRRNHRRASGAAEKRDKLR